MKALVADDDLISRMALSDMLAGLRRLQVVEASDGEAAWQLLEMGLAPMICFFDIRMPGASGLELLRRMRTDNRFIGIPIMLITSTADRETVVQASKLAVDGFVVKPLDMRSTPERVDQLVTRFEREVLDDVEQSSRRLGIKTTRFAQYVTAMTEQAEGIMNSLANGGDWPEMSTIDALRTAAQTLRAKHMVAMLDRMRQAISSSAEEKEAAHWASTLNVATQLLRDSARVQGIRIKERTVVVDAGTVQIATETSSPSEIKTS